MAKTIEEVRNRALVMLGKLALGATPTGALAADMEDVYDQVYAKLERRGMVTWSNTDDIPDEFVEDVTSMMAFERSEGIPADRYARIADAAARAYGNIAALIDGKWTNSRKYRDY